MTLFSSDRETTPLHKGTQVKILVTSKLSVAKVAAAADLIFPLIGLVLKSTTNRPNVRFVVHKMSIWCRNYHRELKN